MRRAHSGRYEGRETAIALLRRVKCGEIATVLPLSDLGPVAADAIIPDDATSSRLPVNHA
jgi:hypothetical protein